MFFLSFRSDRNDIDITKVNGWNISCLELKRYSWPSYGRFCTVIAWKNMFSNHTDYCPYFNFKILVTHWRYLRGLMNEMNLKNLYINVYVKIQKVMFDKINFIGNGTQTI